MSKIYEFEKLEPKGVLTWFKKICAIPHGSGNEKAVCDMLADGLEKAGCKIEKRFKTGAIYATKKATKGFEKAPMTLLQGHTDMILAQEEGMQLDMKNQAITPYYDTAKKWLKAEGTTLGADNGIGVAIIMEIATNPQVEHGPLEIFLTTGEEDDPSVCMSQLPEGLFKSKNLINLDTDQPDCVYMASACCVFFSIRHKLTYVPVKTGTKTYNINLKNLKGGHSGLTIHNNHINCIILVMSVLREFAKQHYCAITGIQAGNAANAIPTFITCDVQIEPKYAKELEARLAKAIDTGLVITQNHDLGLTWKITPCQQEKKCVSQKQSLEIYTLFSVLANGCFNFSLRGDCMYNSSNLGTLKIFDGILSADCSQRSFVSDDAKELRERQILICKHFGIKDNEITTKSGCSAWLVREPEKSNLIQTWAKCHTKVWGKAPRIMPCAGGLEVAEIVEKHPKLALNSLSAGPRIWAEHTTRESCPLDTIQKLWKVITLTLKGMKK